VESLAVFVGTMWLYAEYGAGWLSFALLFPMGTEPKHPWRLDTNDRYRETVTTIMGLSTAALLLPVFLAREFLGIDAKVPLKDVVSGALYWSWGLFGFSIFSAIAFCFFSAKWARLAWDQPVGLFGIGVSDSFIERGLELFWCTALAFLEGLALSVYFFAVFGASAS
jgi:hypothetical protein